MSDMWSYMTRWTLLILVGARREDTKGVTYERVFQHIAGHGATPKQVILNAGLCKHSAMLWDIYV